MVETAISYSKGERWKALTSIMFGHLSDGLDLVIISFLLLPLSAYFHTSTSMIALAVTTSLVFSAPGGIIFGWVADRFGRKTGLVLSVMIFGISSLGTAFSQNLVELFIARAVLGLGIGGEWGVGMAQITEVWTSKRRATGGGVLQAFFIIGAIIGAFVARYMLTDYGFVVGWRYAFVIAGIVALVGMVVIITIMPESKFWLDYNNKRKSGQLPKDYDIRSPVIQIFSKSVRRWTFFALLIGGSNLFIYFSYASFMPTLLAADYHLSVLAFSNLLVIGMAIAVPFYWINGYVADVLSRKRSAIVFGLEYLISTILFLYVVIAKVPYSVLLLFPLFWVYTAVSIGQGVSAEYGVWFGEHFPTKMRSTATNFAYMVGRGLGGGLAPIVVPLLEGGFGGIKGLGLAMGVAMIIGAVIQFGGLFGLRETKGSTITSL